MAMHEKKMHEKKHMMHEGMKNKHMMHEGMKNKHMMHEGKSMENSHEHHHKSAMHHLKALHKMAKMGMKHKGK